MIEIKNIRHSEIKGELLKLFRVAFSSSISQELWDWKYFKNPLTSSNPDVIVAMDGTKIVGAMPFFLSKMWFRNSHIKVASPTDLMVDPQIRRQGLFWRMNQFALKSLREEGFAFIFNFPNEMARPGYLKQGWNILCPAEKLLRFIKPDKILKSILKNKFLGAGLGFFYNVILNPRLDTGISSDRYQTKVFEKFSGEMENVDSLRNKSRIEMVRSESYLRWRFDIHPERNYNYILLEDNMGVCGYAVIETEIKNNGFVQGNIVDLLVKDDEVDVFNELIKKCINELKQSKCDVVSLWALNYQKFTRHLLRELGFKSTKSFPYNKFTDAFYVVVKELDDQVVQEAELNKEENWRITLAYTDTT